MISNKVGLIIKKLVHLSIGLYFVGLGLFLLASGLSFGLFFSYEIGGEQYYFDGTIIVDIFCMVLGFFHISRSIKLSRVPDDAIVSYPYSRLIGGLVLFNLAYQNIGTLGIDLGHGQPGGTWLFLGGLSLWFPTSLLPFIVGIFMLVFSLFPYFKVHIHRDDELFTFVDIRTFGGKVVETKNDDIDYISLTNRETGPRFIWIFVFIIPIVFLYIDGFSFLLNPNTFGEGFTTATAYITAANVILFVLILILFWSHHIFRMVTKDHVCDQPLFPASFSQDRKLRLEKMTYPRVDRAFTKVSEKVIKQPKNFKRIGLGLLFIYLGIITRIEYIYASEMLRFVFIITGLILLVDGIKQDANLFNKGITVKKMGKQDEYLLSTRGGYFKSEIYIRNKIGRNEMDPDAIVTKFGTIQPRKLTMVDHAVFTSIPFFMGFQMFPILALGPLSSSSILAMGAMNWAMFALVAFLLLLVFVDPRRLLKFTFGDRNYSFPIKMEGTVKQGTIERFKSIATTFWKKYKIVWKNNRKSVLSRFLEILIAFGIGIVWSAMIFLG
ncbi:MAG: hypothetical protein ACTSUE_22515 [Promethearchaeota archaeon]